ncbi:hypothetical protein [Nocardia paucivorans]|uniref:hypothetical protein n=1 Tax=Nocardia paucivorans TaxID=114259 RepID=UPI000592C3A6|nr:hypothetical protein [Nocardia paucivorans]
MTSRPEIPVPVIPETEVRPDDTAPARAPESWSYFPPPRELRGNLNGWTYLAVFLAAVLVTILSARAIAALDSGQPLRPWLYTAVAVWVVSLLVMLSAFAGGRTCLELESTRFEHDRGGLVIRRSLAYETAAVLFLGSLAAACALFGIGTHRDSLTLPLHPPIPAWAALAVAVAVFAYLVVYLARPRAHRLVLRPGHIALPTTIRPMKLLSWAELSDVTVVSRTSCQGTVRLETASRKPKRPRRAHIRAEKLSIGSSAAYWLIRFYHRHPELREELSDERALERLRVYGVVEEH